MSAEDHARIKAKSYGLLDDARSNKYQGQYDSAATRQRIANCVESKNGGNPPYEWQLDIGEALHMGLDSVVIAGTGAGKTLPFTMPIFFGKKSIIISPLNALQEDQVRRFTAMGLRAVAVNGTTWSSALAKQLEDLDFDIILTSPEMCFEHEGFRRLLTSGAFSKHLGAMIIDECHVIESWGKKFRTSFSALGTLRSFVPVGVPILATSATLTPSGVETVTDVLEIDLDSSFFMNLGNDRPNITYNVVHIKSQQDFEALKPFFTATYSRLEDIPKTGIYIDCCISTQVVANLIRSWLPPEFHDAVAFFHSHRNDRSKKIIMDAFMRGLCRVLISTESAGMGTDIPDMLRVMQFGLCDSLSTWLQRAGRCARDKKLQGEAYLMAEVSMFKKQRKRKKKKKKGQEDESGGEEESVTAGIEDDNDNDVIDDNENDGEPMEEDDNEGNEERAEEQREDLVDTLLGALQLDDGPGDDEGLSEFKKKCPDCLRKYIETKGCRRDEQDRHFHNPPRLIPPKGDCCDNCVARIQREAIEAAIEETRNHRSDSVNTSTGANKRTAPDDDNSSNSNDESTDEEHPLKRQRQVIPKTRTKDWLKEAKATLGTWRLKLKRRDYLYSSLSADAILPDYVLVKLASRARIRSIEDIENETSPPWVLAQKHGEEALEILRQIDDKRAATKATEKATRLEERKRKRDEERAQREREEVEARAKAQEESAKAIREQQRVMQEAENRVRQYWTTGTSAQLQHPTTPRLPLMEGSSAHTHYEGVAMMIPAHPPAVQNSMISGACGYGMAASYNYSAAYNHLFEPRGAYTQSHPSSPPPPPQYQSPPPHIPFSKLLSLGQLLQL